VVPKLVSHPFSPCGTGGVPSQLPPAPPLGIDFPGPRRGPRRPDLWFHAFFPVLFFLTEALKSASFFFLLENPGGH